MLYDQRPEPALELEINCFNKNGNSSSEMIVSVDTEDSELSREAKKYCLVSSTMPQSLNGETSTNVSLSGIKSDCESSKQSSICKNVTVKTIHSDGHSSSISSECKESDEEVDTLHSGSYFDFLDDYIRFDITRTGVSCFSGYSISVQYEDDFLLGKAGTPCCCWNLVFGVKSRVRLWHGGKAFELEYFPKVSCIRPKNCVYRVKIPEQRKEIGTIHFQADLVHIYNAYEKCLSLRRKQGPNTYSIKTEAGDRLASVEIFRGFRGDIMNYGLSILGDAKSTDKALLIGLTLAMDIRQRESEMRCSLFWVPLCCFVVIGLFSLLPWLYFYDNHNT